MFWLLPTVFFGGCGECLAWAARLWSSFSPLNQTPYMIQYVPLIVPEFSYSSLWTCTRIVAAILAPTPFLGSIFMIFRRVTQLLGTQYSRLSPRWCECLIGDLVSVASTDPCLLPDSRIFLTAVRYPSLQRICHCANDLSRMWSLWLFKGLEEG